MMNLVCGLLALGFQPVSQSEVRLGPFQLVAQAGTLKSLKQIGDPNQTEFLQDNAQLGAINLQIRKGSDWQSFSSAQIPGETLNWSSNFDGLDVASRFVTEGDSLVWKIQLKNSTAQSIDVGGLSIPLPMRTRTANNTKPSVLKHSFISGSGSFAFWMRLDSQAPYLLMTTLPGTQLEYWNRDSLGYQVHIHSNSQAEVIKARQGSWRQTHSNKILKPGASAEYGFRFRWAKNYDEVRRLLATGGGLDVQVAPGMTVPTDLKAVVALKSSNPVSKLLPEFPSQTQIRALPSKAGYQRFEVQFQKLGENKITVFQKDGSATHLEFFSCKPYETLIKKRGSFLAKSQRRNTNRWFEGLIAEWAMDRQKWLTPDDYDRIKGWRIYEVTCDDPGLGKPGFLAMKNVEYPVQSEVDALDHYIEKFVWGGLQHTDQEKYPFGIYGIPDWKQNRESQAEDRTKGVDHLWRPYDYPHIVAMYTGMYKIAKMYPSIRTRLSAREYLRRAAGTANAMFTVPLSIVRWSAYNTGFYNEVVIPDLIEQLKSENQLAEASGLTALWERKVKTFVDGRVDLFGSEYAFDSTGFESTQVLADYALEHHSKLGFSKEKAKSFLEKQMAANLFCRGVIEPAYYYLGSDYRGGAGDAYTLTYMSQMGGASVMQYALHHANNESAPAYWRLGFQSYSSAWALINAGDPASNYGYWYPGKANDGAAGGGFEPASYGETWLQQPHGRGSWYYSCESDLGFTGALRAARTLVADDPIFGRYCFGGTSQDDGTIYRFKMQDGLRRRLSIRTSPIQIDLELIGTRISANQMVELDFNRKEIRFSIEPSSFAEARIQVENLKTNLEMAVGGGKPISLHSMSKLGPSNSARKVILQWK